jgi:hypothetical protein
MSDIGLLFSIWGMSYIIKESDILAPVRQWVMQRSVFMSKLLWCWWCVGFWAGVFIYLLHSGTATVFETFSPFEWLVWGCAGSAASAFGNAVMQRLEWQPITKDNASDTKTTKETT